MRTTASEPEPMLVYAENLGLPVADLGSLLGLAAVGLTLKVWRNSPLEDAHADPNSPLTDAEMMRTNAATTRLVRETLTELATWALDDRDLNDDPEELDLLVDEDSVMEELLEPLEISLTRRVLPFGYTVREAPPASTSTI